MSSLAIPNNLYTFCDKPSFGPYLYCGKPPKIKKLEDIIGKKFEINGHTAIITYPLSYLVNKGDIYFRKISYTVELLKHELLEKMVWEYKDGRIQHRTEKL